MGVTTAPAHCEPQSASVQSAGGEAEDRDAIARLDAEADQAPCDLAARSCRARSRRCIRGVRRACTAARRPCSARRRRESSRRASSVPRPTGSSGSTCSAPFAGVGWVVTGFMSRLLPSRESAVRRLAVGRGAAAALLRRRARRGPRVGHQPKRPSTASAAGSSTGRTIRTSSRTANATPMPSARTFDQVGERERDHRRDHHQTGAGGRRGGLAQRRFEPLLGLPSVGDVTPRACASAASSRTRS